LKIPKELFEAVSRRRADNTMTNRKKDNNNYKKHKAEEELEDTKGVIRIRK
jgi:hypothetical protein